MIFFNQFSTSRSDECQGNFKKCVIIMIIISKHGVSKRKLFIFVLPNVRMAFLVPNRHCHPQIDAK